MELTNEQKAITENNLTKVREFLKKLRDKNAEAVATDPEPAMRQQFVDALDTITATITQSPDTLSATMAVVIALSIRFPDLGVFVMGGIVAGVEVQMQAEERATPIPIGKAGYVSE